MDSSYNSGSGTQLLATIKNKKIENAQDVPFSGSVVSKSGNLDLAPVTNALQLRRDAVIEIFQPTYTFITRQ